MTAPLSLPYTIPQWGLEVEKTDDPNRKTGIS